MRQRVLNESLELLKNTQGGNAAMALLPQPVTRERDRDMSYKERDREMLDKEREVSSSQGRGNQQESDDMSVEDLKTMCYDLQVNIHLQKSRIHIDT